MKLKHIFLMILALAMLLSLIGCSSKPKYSEDEQKELIEAFLSCVEKEDYDAAAKYLYPGKTIDLGKYFTELEESLEIDLSDGIEVRRYTGYTPSEVEGGGGGTVYSHDILVKINGSQYYVLIELLENGNDFGVNYFDLEPKA